MPIWALILTLIYIFTLLFVFTFSLVQLHLVYHYLFTTKNSAKAAFKISDTLPKVTIQLPIFNEMYVVERLLDAVSKIEYPLQLLEIQVLDDSTDETSSIIAKKITELQKKGFDINQIKRQNRAGFKAGALAFGTGIAKGEFIAIFDADFLPKPSFLLEALPSFDNDKIGMVQSRWLHINENYSLLTQLQAFGLDAHFTIDQVGRNVAGLFSNFNGTGGIWRKTCIENAGGWAADCLTEDLDLSYRAQIKGWKFIYLEKLGNLAELPAEIQAVKTQQFRWAKGAAEVARKLIFTILKQPQLSFSIKIHSFFHLANSATYLGLMLTALLTLPIVIIQKKYPQIANLLDFAQYFQLSFVFLGIYFWVSFRQKHKNFIYFLGFYPRFLAFMMGLSLYNSVGVLQGYFGKKTAFIRTPKFNINSKADNWYKKTYVVSKVNFYLIFEGILCIYFLFALWYVFENKAYGSIPFLSMLLFGYLSVFGYGIWHRLYYITHSRK